MTDSAAHCAAGAADAAGAAGAPEARPIIEARGIRRSFPLRRGLLRGGARSVTAVDGVDLRLPQGTTLGVVGESGSGKSTLGRILAGLDTADAGELTVAGHRILGPPGPERRRRLSDRKMRDFRRRVQVVFQDPFGSLDPTKTLRYTIGEPLVVHGLADRSSAGEQAAALLELVGLAPELADRFPRQLSGGQRQRASIARAMALQPEVLIADEPTSALDLSSRSGILNLLLDLQLNRGLSIVLISHDMATIGHMAHEVLVMHRGRVVESGPTATVLEHPEHPYTQALLSAVPIADPALQRSRRRLVFDRDSEHPPVTHRRGVG